METQKLLKERDAASYLAMSISWLRLQRSRGGGPPYMKLAKSVRYRLKDLDEWIESRRVMTEAAR